MLFIRGDEPTRCAIVAELGINHNGDVETALRMVEMAAGAGCDAVKLQKRTVERVYSPEELDTPRESPLGATNRDLKVGLELDADAYAEINRRCGELDLAMFASVWDLEAVAFMEQFEPPVHKIASPLVTHEHLLREVRDTGRPVILSTGMSTEQELDAAVELVGTENLVLLHCVSAYPAPPGELHLRRIDALRERYGCPVGYSGHELELVTTIAAVARGAMMVERHVTLDRGSWGSDQNVSIEPGSLKELVEGVRLVEAALGSTEIAPLACELPAREKLRDAHFERQMIAKPA